MEDKLSGLTSHSKAIIEAVRPFAWKDKYPPTSALTADEAKEIEAKWGDVISGKSQKTATKSKPKKKR